MEKTKTTSAKYTQKQKPVTPPHVSLGTLRKVAGLTIAQLIIRIETATGNTYSRGAVSAMESGIRGVSVQFITDLAAAYGVDRSAITTTYLPRVRSRLRQAS